MKRSFLAACAAALLAMATPLASIAQSDYPNKPVTMVVPFPPGGVADITARPLAEVMGRILKQPVIVENKAGAGGGVGMQYVARAKPDGYTVLLALASLTVLPEADKVLGRAPQYQIADLKPIARFTADPTVLAVRADSPWQTFADFVAAAKAALRAINAGRERAWVAAGGTRCVPPHGMPMWVAARVTQRLHGVAWLMCGAAPEWARQEGAWNE